MLKVGVIIVCYNSATTIRRTLLSIQCQTLQPDELIIIDGNSRDDTLGIIKEFSHLVTTLISEKDGGIYNAMNKGAVLARGKFILFLNSDDWLEKNSLEFVVNTILKNSNYHVYYGDSNFYNKKIFQFKHKSNIDKILKKKLYLPSSNLLQKRHF